MAFDSNIKGYMTFGKSFSRGAAFPLEAYEIWTDYDALVAYAANTDPNKDPSYIGQKVTYVDKTNNKVTHYGIEIDGTLKELGASPIGDEKSIVIGDNNTISLKGIAGLVFERDILGEDGEPTGQKEEVKYQPLMTKNGLVWIEPSKTTVEGLATLIDDLTVRVKALEDNRVTEEELAAAVKVVADKVGVPAEGDESTATLYERIAAEVLRATQAESALSDRIGAAKDGETAATGVYAYVDGVVNALVNGVDPDKIDSLNELIAWVEAHPDIVSGLDERLDAAEAILDGFGGEEEPATVKDYIDAHALAADGKYATKTEITEAGYAVAADIARDYATKQELTDHNTAAEAKYATKEALKATDDVAKDAQNRVDIVEGKIDEITSVGGEPNVIEKIKVNGVTLEVEKDTEGKSTKTVNIAVPTSIVGMEGYSALDGRVTKNTNDIVALQGQLGTTDGNVSGILQRLGALETEVGVEEKSRIDVLEGVLNGVDEDEGLIAIVTGHGTKIGLLEAADIRIEKKADDNAAAILALQNKVNTGDKTVKDYVDDAVKAVADTIDFTPYAKTEDVAKTYATIAALEGIYKAGSGVEGAEDYVAPTGILAEEIARAKAAEKDLDDAIKLLTNGAGTSEIDSVKELIDYVNNHGATVEGINDRLDGHDTLLAGIGGEGQPATVVAAIEAAKYTLPGATVEALGGIKSAADVDGKTAVNKVYVDATTNVAEVKAFSTDNLVQGNMTLVLNGGDAQVVTNA